MTVIVRSFWLGQVVLFSGLAIWAPIALVVAKSSPSIVDTVYQSPWLSLLPPLISAIVIAALLRIIRNDSLRARSWDVVDAVAVAVTCIVAVVFRSSLDYSAQLVVHLLRAEDNSLWVGVVAQSLRGAGPASAIAGEVNVLSTVYLVTLGAVQGVGLPDLNAAFSAYLLPIVLAPVIATIATTRAMEPSRSGRTLVVLGLTVLWVLAPVLALFNYGHLSTIITFIYLVLLLGVATSTLGVNARIWMSLALGLGAAAAWFPAVLLVGPLILYLLIYHRAEASRWTIATLGGVVAVVVGAFIVHFRASLGLEVSSAGAVKDFVAGLFARGGGSTAFDPILVLVALGLLIALAALVREDRWRGAERVRILLFVTGVVVAIAVLGAALGSPGSYGETKIRYVVVASVLVLGTGMLAAVKLPRRVFTSIAVAALSLLFAYGPGYTVASHNWPGDPWIPEWWPSLERVAADASTTGEFRPVACYADDKGIAYLCNRWSGALAGNGISNYLALGQTIFDSGDVYGLVSDYVESGSAADSRLITIGPTSQAWGRLFRREAYAVYDELGNLIRAPRAPGP